VAYWVVVASYHPMEVVLLAALAHHVAGLFPYLPSDASVVHLLLLLGLIDQLVPSSCFAVRVVDPWEVACLCPWIQLCPFGLEVVLGPIRILHLLSEAVLLVGLLRSLLLYFHHGEEQGPKLSSFISL